MLPYPEMIPQDFDFKGWLDNHNHVMYEEGGSVGLCTFEYTGLYTVHWYFKVRGREAINLGRKMLDDLFTNHGAEAVRGLTRIDIKAARWAARQLGMKSYGIVTYPEGEYELFCMTKDEFYGKDH